MTDPRTLKRRLNTFYLSADISKTEVYKELPARLKSADDGVVVAPTGLTLRAFLAQSLETTADP